MVTAYGWDTLNQTVLEYANIELTDKEYELLQYSINIAENEERVLRTVLGSIISSRAFIGWTTPGHTGVDVNLYSYGLRPAGLGGVIQNIEVGNLLWAEMDFIDTMNEITANLRYIPI